MSVSFPRSCIHAILVQEYTWLNKGIDLLLWQLQQFRSVYRLAEPCVVLSQVAEVTHDFQSKNVKDYFYSGHLRDT